MRPLPSQNSCPRPWGPCKARLTCLEKGTRYCATAPKITDPRKLPRPPPSSPVLPLLDGHNAPSCQPRPLGTTDYSFRPTEHCLHSHIPPSCMCCDVVYQSLSSQPANTSGTDYLHQVGAVVATLSVWYRLVWSGLVSFSLSAGRVGWRSQVQCVRGRLVSARQSECSQSALLPVNQHITGGGDRDKVRTKA